MTDDTARRDLPEAFIADDPSEDPKKDQKHETFGVGHLVGSVVPEGTQNERRMESDGDSEARVDEASEDSFPGSDPPAFGRTIST